MPGARRKASARHRQKPDPLAKMVGARIRKLRQEQSFSFDAFVGETELGRGYVSELERGLVVPTIHVLDRVARALGVTMADLVIGDSPREQLFDLARGLDDRMTRKLISEAEGLSDQD